MGDDPYTSETQANTDAPWLTDHPLKVDVTGLRDYAKDMLDQQLDLASRSAHLTHVFDLPVQAWNGMVLGEAAFLRAQLLGNAAELSAYLGNLGQTLYNVGAAAQTVADIYGTADAIGAADLNDVLFAFGDPTVPRPDGLPKNIGQTYDEALMADDKKVAPAPASSADWGPATITYQSAYQSTQTSVDTVNGQTREVVTINVPGGGTVVTTTIYSNKHEVISTSSTRTTTSYDIRTNTEVDVVDSDGSTTTTTTTYGSSQQVVHEDSSTTTTVDGKTETTGHREVTVDPKTGVRTETTYNAKGEVIDRVVIGPETKGEPGVQTPINKPYDPTQNGALNG